MTHHRPITPLEAQQPKLIAYVSCSTLSQLLECGETTIWDWVKRGHLPKPRKIGGAARWDWAEVRATLDGQTKPAQFQKSLDANGKHAPDDEDPILKASRGR